jgi:hypothetical protein
MEEDQQSLIPENPPVIRLQWNVSPIFFEKGLCANWNQFEVL